ncbi:hypothetical protein EXIGLDRAFT_479630 [Exidia glandulosa HHB12029]|uniref:Uncharacterized protein n=1 Tax=Exidia glandulosa HHB12029 TaxID=1314781 RepID=A0A165JRN2_EXIGL|nr:hypothetical protein EXIGLDRAFT_479630 [Exidia glandulosa HHB12029]
MMQRFWRALTYTLHAARSVMLANPNAEVYPLIPCFRVCEVYMGSPTGASVMLNMFLSPFPAPGVDPSVWTTVRTFQASFLGLELAGMLAAALSSYIRQVSADSGTPLYVDLFFADLAPADVVAALVTAWDVRRRAFPDDYFETIGVHLMQHCSEIRPDWWLAALDYAEQSASEHERQMMLALKDEVARRGPCVQCPAI